MRIYSLFILFILSFGLHASVGNHVNWRELSPEIFKQAAKENKIVLLNLEANWCHWCHVMKDSTYSNPEVINYINQHFIAVKADQDANPELANRYKNYGWPATIFINAKGEDVAKRSGYIASQYFLNLLEAIVSDPYPEESSTNFSSVSNENNEDMQLLNTLKNNFIKTLDIYNGGYNQAQKYVAFDPFEFALFNSKNQKAKLWLKNSINGAKQLMDPAWGGIYQYSTHNDWKHLHFEKLLSIQARYIDMFLLNYYYNNDNASLDCAKQIIEYCNRFLENNDGLYCNAQDADLVPGKHAETYFALNDADRLKKGVPKIDTNTYTDNNASMGFALLKLWQATNNEDYYRKALYIKKQLLLRKTPSGLFLHSDKKNKIMSLKDQIDLLAFFIELVKTNISDLQSQRELTSLCKAVQSNFVLKNGALKSSSSDNGLIPKPLVEENIKAARLLNWYAAYSKDNDFHNMAKNIYQFLISDQISKHYYSEPALLILSKELQNEPVQCVYLNNNKENGFSNTLHAMLPFYGIIYDGNLKQLPKEKQELMSDFKENVLFMCTSNYCSLPIFSKSELENVLKENNVNP